MVATGINKGGRVPLMWPVALFSGLAALSCGWAELRRNPPTLKKKKKEKSYSKNILLITHICQFSWMLMVCNLVPRLQVTKSWVGSGNKANT